MELDESGKRIDLDSVDERDDGRVPRHAQKNQKVYPGIKQDGWSGILRYRDAAICRGGERTSSGIIRHSGTPTLPAKWLPLKMGW